MRARVLASVVCAVATAVLIVGASSPAQAYEVRPGDTLSEIAVAHHVPLSRLIRINHLPDGGDLIYAGQHLRLRWRHHHHGHHHGRHHHHGHHHHGHHHGRHHGRHHHHGHHHGRHHHHGHHHGRHHHAHRHHHRLPNPSQTRVRHAVTRVARYHGVRPPFALAIAWQESGWQQDEISSARAIGIMQVLPSTGRWLSQLVGFHLDIWHTRGNVRAGVIYLRFLEDHTPHHRRAIAGYYQGLASVRAHGMYHSTRRYVASVRALERSFRAGHYPL